MKITIQGQDCTSSLDASRPLTIERKLNEPSVCQFWLSLPTISNMIAPARAQSITVIGDDGTTYFTGYIAVSPLPEYAGFGMTGPQYRIAIQAVSDELLLDQAGVTPTQGAAGETIGALVTTLVTRTGQTNLSTSALTLNTAVAHFVADPGACWSNSAGKASSQARAAYRAVSGALSLGAVPTSVHPLSETDGTLQLADLALTAAVTRALANDVTVCGEPEPVAYVTEYFLGDGLTTQFLLAADPYSLPSSKATIIHELFNEGAINTRVWGVLGASGYLSLGAAGLTMQGGNGIDGETLISWLDQVEMGGTLLLEATGVALSAGSTGVIAGLFVGLGAQTACTAGFQVTAQQGSGAVSVGPIIQGAAEGSTYSINPTNQYALRIRVHCSEPERIAATYRSYGDSGAISCGGQANTVGAFLQFEIQEFVNGVAGMPVILYDGSIASLPAACMVIAASSINLQGTMRALNLTNLGSAWVVSTPPGGTQSTRRVGTTAQAAECHVESAGKLVFYMGYTPPVGEQVAVRYRTIGRAVGRQVNAASQQALTQSGLPPVAAWIGSVTSPAARSSQDCRNAAQAMGQAASGVSALWGGTYKGTRATFAADVWPGDALQLIAPSADLNTQVVVRTVKLNYTASYPDLVGYEIAFANDWADDLAIKSSVTVPADTWLPAIANPTLLANLTALAVTSMTGNAVTINTGVTAPPGGGFEIRRRDFAFNPGEDTDLVMRGSQSTMTFTRTSASDRYYIRMYDASSPPNYSEFSAALFINLPLAA
jgi:hypothetical protein